jgi:hypothetical protein
MAALLPAEAVLIFAELCARFGELEALRAGLGCEVAHHLAAIAKTTPPGFRSVVSLAANEASAHDSLEDRAARRGITKQAVFNSDRLAREKLKQSGYAAVCSAVDDLRRPSHRGHDNGNARRPAPKA